MQRQRRVFGAGGGGSPGRASGPSFSSKKSTLMQLPAHSREALARMKSGAAAADNGLGALPRVRQQREAQQRRKDEISLRYLRRGEKRRSRQASSG